MLLGFWTLGRIEHGDFRNAASRTLISRKLKRVDEFRVGLIDVGFLITRNALYNRDGKVDDEGTVLMKINFLAPHRRRFFVARCRGLVWPRVSYDAAGIDHVTPAIRFMRLRTCMYTAGALTFLRVTLCALESKH